MPRSPVQKLAPFIHLGANADFINFSANASLEPGAGSFVLAIWWRPDATVVNEAASHVIFQSTATTYSNGLLLNAFGTGLSVYLQSGPPNVASGVGSFSPGVWYRIVIVGDSVAQTVKVYINGVLIQSTGSLTWNVLAVDQIRLGASGDLGATARGDYAELVFCKASVSGFALPTLTDVQNDYAGTAPFVGQSARYGLHEGTGTNVATSVGAGSAGTLNGGAAFKFSDRQANVEAPANLQVRSEEFDNVSIWTISGTASVTANAVANPVNGNVDADAILDTVTNGIHGVLSAGCGTGARDQSMCFSVWVKSANTSKSPVVLVGLSGGFTGGGVYVNMLTGAKSDVGVISTVESWGNGWYRISIFGPSYGPGTCSPYIFACPSIGSSSYAGDGLAALYVWGGQFVPGRGPAAYAKTTSAPIGPALGAGGVRDRNPQAENMLPQSGLLSDASWSKNGSSVTAAAAANPVDGTVDAWALVEDGTSTAHYAAQTVTAPYALTGNGTGVSSLVGGTWLTFSAYVKAVNRPFCILGAAGGGQACWYDLSGGAVATFNAGIFPRIVALGNGWYRCSITVPILDNTAQNVFIVYAAPSNGVASYAGNSLPALYIYQPQVTHGSQTIPLFKTTGAGTIEAMRSASLPPHNLVQRSEELDNGYWFNSNITITANALANPVDGAVTADLVTETAAAGAVHTNTANDSITTNPGTGSVCTLSQYLKDNGRRWAGLRSGVTIGHEATFDLQNGTISNISGCLYASITPVGNGWYRCSITFVLESSSTPVAQCPFLSNTGGSYAAYNGDITKSVYAWGAQFSNSPGQMPYLKTTSAIVQAAQGARGLIV